MTLTATIGHTTFAVDCSCLIAAIFASHNAAVSPPLAPVGGAGLPVSSPVDEGFCPDDFVVDEDVDVSSDSFG